MPDDMAGMVPIRSGTPENQARYLVSRDGRIWDTKRNMFLPQYLRDGKYYSVCLSGGKKGKMHAVHRLVADALLPNPDRLPQVNHKDGIKTHNQDDNLEWCSCSDNHRHAFRTGIRKHSEKTLEAAARNIRIAHKLRRQLSAADVTKMKALSAAGVTQREIANTLGTSQPQVSRILRGINYKEMSDGK